jgi:multicomponent Na+:H+ antiporter subunit A
MFALLALHLVVGTVVIAFGVQLGRRAFAVAAVAPLATVVWAVTKADQVLDGRPVTETFAWVEGLDIAIDLRLDAFSLAMVALVSGVGFLIFVYSLGYFAPSGHDAHGDGQGEATDAQPGVGRLAGVMTLFAGSMLGVVLSDHLMALFVFWELTSVTSYLLIGNDDTNLRARAAALQAILITGLGGLVMLAGLTIIGQAAGTYRLSELIADPPTGNLVNAGLVCVLIGAFTKSAQAPFSSWLPAAMVAPTPVSAYLHSATMVKAGVYLVARLAPMFATQGSWRVLVLTVGSVTMLIGGLRALRQTDLKLLLAYGTVSQLGFMMLLFGTGDDHIAQAGVVLVLAHAAFKAALFMVVGIIDHETGTRDIRELHGFGSGWRLTQVVVVAGAASMAGFPPLFGFISKEKALEGYLDHGDFTASTVVLVVIVVASILTFAYSARFVLGVFGAFGADDHDVVSSGAHAPSFGFVAPAALLTVVTVVCGVVPSIADRLVEASTIALHPLAQPAHLHLWAGFTEAFTLSMVVIAGGVVLTLLRTQVVAAQRVGSRAIGFVPSSEQSFNAILRGTGVVARRTTATVQNGSLPIYVAVIMLAATVVPLVAFAPELDHFPDLVETPIHLAIVALIVGAGLGASLVRRRIAAALMLGAVGYAMAALYVTQGAPDLALTQFAIETLSTVLFVLVLRFLPRTWTHQAPAIAAPMRLGVSVAVGAAIFVFALAASGARSDVSGPQQSDVMVENALPKGKGHNVVNVILVDFRGRDTMGEITVLLVAAAGTVSLARSGRRRSDTDAPTFEEILADPDEIDGQPAPTDEEIRAGVTR